MKHEINPAKKFLSGAGQQGFTTVSAIIPDSVKRVRVVVRRRRFRIPGILGACDDESDVVRYWHIELGRHHGTVRRGL